MAKFRAETSIAAKWGSVVVGQVQFCYAEADVERPHVLASCKHELWAKLKVSRQLDDERWLRARAKQQLDRFADSSTSFEASVQAVYQL